METARARWLGGRGALLGGRGSGAALLASEVVERRAVQVGADDAEGGVRGGGDGVLEGVPPDVVLAYNSASDFLPVGLGVVDGCDGLPGDFAGYGPAGLGDPDFLAAADGVGLVVGVPVELLAVVDGVVLGALEVGVGVHAEPVDFVSDGGV